MLKATVVKPDLTVRFDLLDVAYNSALGMREFWADQLDEGEQPTGEDLDLNKQGKPLGRGRGTLIKKWVVRRSKRSRGRASAYARPYQGKRYRWAVWSLAKRGLLFSSFDGESKAAWNRIATEVARDALEDALTRKRKRRRGRITEWGTRPWLARPANG